MLGPLLGRFPLGDILEHRHRGDDAARRRPDRRRVDDEDTSGSVAPLELDLLANRDLAPLDRAREWAVRSEFLGAVMDVQRSAPRTRPTQYFHQLLVKEQDAPGGRLDDEDARRQV